MCIQKPMETLRKIRERYMLIVGLITVAIMVVVVIIWWLYLRRQFVKPLNKVVVEAERFAKEPSAPEKKLGKRLSRIYEIQSLAKSIDNMEEDTLAYIDNLTTVLAEKQKMGAELEVAKLIQENSVPNKFPAFPDRTEFD